MNKFKIFFSFILLVIVCISIAASSVFAKGRKPDQGDLVEKSVKLYLHPFYYHEGFENGVPFLKWANNGTYKINSKGISSEKASSGEKIFFNKRLTERTDLVAPTHFSNEVSYNSKNDFEISIIKAIDSQKILPDTAFPINARDKLQIITCRGEYESGSFVVKSVSKVINEFEIEVADLVSEDHILPAENIDIKVVKPWFQHRGAWYSHGNQLSRYLDNAVLVPELLLKDDSLVRVDLKSKNNYLKGLSLGKEQFFWINNPEFSTKRHDISLLSGVEVKDSKILKPLTLEAGKNKQFWVTIKAPIDIPNGTYKGKFNLKADEVIVGVINIEVKILPFDLMRSSISYNIYYRGKLYDHGSLSSEFKTALQLKQELRNIVAHGLHNTTVYQSIGNKLLFKKILEIRKQVGFETQPLMLLSLTTENCDTPKKINRLIERANQVRNLTQPYSIPEIFIYGDDESKGAALTAQHDAWEKLHDAGFKIFVAGYTGAFEINDDKLDILVHAHRPLTSEAEKYHMSNCKLYNYGNPQTGPENPYMYRRNYGVVLWAAGYDGAMLYAYQDSFGSGWNDFDHNHYRDHNFTYPTSNGVIDTIAWEGFREAIDDVRYITTLEDKIANVSINNREEQEVFNNATDYLNSLKNEVNKSGGHAKYTRNFNIDLDAVRLKIINFIIQLDGGNV